MHLWTKQRLANGKGVTLVWTESGFNIHRTAKFERAFRENGLSQYRNYISTAPFGSTHFMDWAITTAVYLDPNWLCRLKTCRTDIWGFRAWSCVAESNSCTFKQYKDNGRWRHCDISKRQVPRGQRHSFISPKIWIDSKTAVIFSWSRFKHKTAFWFWKKGVNVILLSLLKTEKQVQTYKLILVWQKSSANNKIARIKRENAKKIILHAFAKLR